MTSGDIWLAIITLAPIALVYVLRANAALVYLSLCLGYVLYSFDSHNALTTVNSLHIHNPTNIKPSSIMVNLVLLLGPTVLTLISQINSIKKSRKLMNLIPAAFCGLFTTLIIVPTLPASIAGKVEITSYWSSLTHYQAGIVGIGAAVAILFFWMNSKHNGKKYHSAS